VPVSYTKCRWRLFPFTSSRVCHVVNDLGIYKVGVEVVSNEMTFDPSFVKIGLLVQKLKRTETHTHTQHCDAGVVFFI